MKTMIRGCVICGEHDKREIDVYLSEDRCPILVIGPFGRHLMAVLCTDDKLRQVHTGKCNAEFMLTDLSRTTREEEQIARDYLK